MKTEEPDATVDARRRLRLGLAASAGGFWLVSIAPVIVAGSDVHGVVMAFWRSLIGFSLLAVILGARREFSIQMFKATAPVGLCFGTSIGLFFWATQITSIANASLITVLQPIPLMIAAHAMFHETIKRRDVVFAVLAISGAVFLVLAGESEGTGNVKGDILALVSILIGAGYFVLAKRCRETMSVLTLMVGMFAWASAILFPFVLISGEQVMPGSRQEWTRVLAVAVLPGMGHVLLNAAHGRAPLNLMGVLQLIMPVNATLLAFWFLDQSVSVLQVVGMAIVIVAVSVQSLVRAADPNLVVPVADVSG